ncbi:TspO/MBR family protein [Blastochloris viridis]|nr:TspO/MBR family protein [Blastochloris viridis]ALK09144.1 TspO/MBR family protein [Blastochloris viridis]BAS00990.1 tryptophan rich sensory protein TspO homologue [Blastochloris viridis]
MMEYESLIALGVFAVICLTAASTGAKYGPDEWYRSIDKPWWIPPNWAFAPAWMLFYTLLAVAGWVAWREGGGSAANPLPAALFVPLALYVLHVITNAVWSPLFFGMHRIDYALIDSAAMWLTLVATIFAFAEVSTLATWLLVIYLGWVTFAFLLNLSVLRLNRDRLPETAPTRH